MLTTVSISHGIAMKHPTLSDFDIGVTDTHVKVTFKPTGRLYTFGRLSDPDDIAHYGPLSHGLQCHGGTDGTDKYSEEEVERMAHTLAVSAITTI
jgi:hypothetical protein